ncbi:bifunctional adenosylcobinamide kinase/adenosylcobinamide-phosphate guanylyltransferase [Herbaspirillum sp. meg3]|uniref:bifunctional adenosylcobinamide kinase/adenosylcobinamide-phosphate guanylyltransferase n=1 Tax=Herbaspirillum sp. meg3 TaxID=2025949 RepID=UPI000B9886A2|nr:bifunctional adenosylcobinamide kinase/adenosylcobinamide-phosphate guanylyltransferase [Herbaspirillum sp. meg3]ASU39002.1 bifunctional adenosylcobinamide kinase/adenosylcobinamide-phosphate guanylyltransferase [Herbaspirillum sp. meg3]
MNQRTLVFGGARSGKSAQAERLAAASGKPVIYIATAAVGDDEMATRIALHRQQRSTHYAHWNTVEEQLALGDAIAHNSTPDNVVLVDCLTVWLSNLLFSEHKEYPEIGRIEAPALFAAERERFLQALSQAKGEVVLVSNEVGMGIVPQGAISRWFVDEAGRLNQSVAAICERVQFVAAGLPLELKGHVGQVGHAGRSA